MSTTIKRVALVAVAALGLSVVAVAPSQAATANANLWVKIADGVSAGAASTDDNNVGGGIAGTYNTVTLGFDAIALGDVVEVTGGTIVSSDVASLNTAKTAAQATSTSAGVIVLATPTVGTITAKFYKNTAGVVSTTADQTVTITVAASALSGVYSAANSSVYLVAGETWTATADATTAPTKVATYVAGDSSTASIVVKYLDGLKKPVTGDSITATITSGPGTILTSNQLSGFVGKFDTVTALAANFSADESVGKYTASTDVDAATGVAAFFLFPNGQVGTSVVTIKNAAGTVLGTKSVTFTSTAVASIEATVVKPTVQGDTTGATGGVIKLVLKDAAGNAMSAPAAYPTATSSDATIATATQSVSGFDTATVGSAGDVYWGITPAAAATYGPVTITFKVGTVTATAVVTLSSAVAATATVADVAVGAGDSIAYAVTLKDAKGYNVPEGIAASNYITSIASVGGIATEVSTTDVKTKAGVLTIKGTAPLVSTTITSTITLTGTAGTANSYLAKTLTGTTLTPKATVSNASTDAAIDAANEAAQAASDATDAALAAADAADAATTKAQEAVDAVATLSAQVSKLITALKAQITTLTNLVIKIQKKVKA